MEVCDGGERRCKGKQKRLVDVFEIANALLKITRV
jgi:hypothetical protein